MITERTCKRLGCGKPDAKRVEWRTPGGFLVATYLCDGCLERWEKECPNAIGPVEIEPPGADVVSLADRRRADRDLKPGNKPDKEPA